MTAPELEPFLECTGCRQMWEFLEDPPRPDCERYVFIPMHIREWRNHHRICSGCWVIRYYNPKDPDVERGLSR